MRTKATIKDVARLAEVSVATVSYVLNNNPNKTISEETRQRVLEAARQLNYISNSAAKALQSSKTNCIGVVIYQSLTLPRHAQVLQGLINALQEMSYSILHCSSEPAENGYPEYLNAYFSHKIDGIVYLGADASALPPEVENTVVEQRIPFVVSDCETNRNISSVVIDYFKGAYDMTNFLIGERGVKKIFYIRPSIDNRQEREREQGVRRAAFESFGVQLETIVFDYDYKSDFTEIYIKQLRSRVEDLDEKSALICSWSGMDQPTLRVLKEANLNIPIATLAQGDLSPELFRNIHYSYLPNLAIGRTCAESILRLLEDENDIRHEIIYPSLTPIINRIAPLKYFNS